MRSPYDGAGPEVARGVCRTGNGGNKWAMLVMTIDQVPGHRVRRILGEVIGVTIKSDNPYVEDVNSIDGNGEERVGLLIQTRQEAVANMIEYARRLGANAIVGMRFDHRTI